MSDARSTETLVVGAGLAGLTAASILVRGGRAVTLVDPRRPGGRARTKAESGFALNDGPHALYARGRAAAELTALGVDLAGAAPAGPNRIWHDGDDHPLPAGPLGLATTPLLSVRSKLAAARLFGSIGRGPDPAADGATLDEWLDRRRAPDDLRGLVEVMVRLTTYAHAPTTMSASAARSQLHLAQRGVRYLHGGWQRLVDGLLDRLPDDVLRCAEVTSLGRDGGRWRAATTAGDVLAEQVVLAAGGPEVATRLAGEDPGWIEGAGPPVRAACLDLGVAGRPPRSVGLLVSTEAPCYGSVHGPPADLAPDGATLAGLVRHLAPHERLDAADARAELDRHARRMGLEPSTAVVDRYLHRMTVAHGTPLADRPRPTGDELAPVGLRCAGDWVGATGADGNVPLLADAAVGSGADAARAILRRCAR